MRYEEYSLEDVNAITHVMALFPCVNNSDQPFSVVGKWGFEITLTQWENIGKNLKQIQERTGEEAFVRFEKNIRDSFATIRFGDGTIFDDVRTGTHILGNMHPSDIKIGATVIGANFSEGIVKEVDHNGEGFYVVIKWANNNDIMPYPLYILHQITLLEEE